MKYREAVDLSALPNVANRWDPAFMFIGAIPHMAEEVRKIARKQDETYSYRGFLVAASGFAIRPASYESLTFEAGNTKANASKSKICAEQKVLQKARRNGFEEIVGLVVAATTDQQEIADVTGLRTPTLHCCEECLKRGIDHPLMRPETLVVSIGLDEDVYQVHTNEEMIAMYATDAPVISSEQQHSVRGFENFTRAQAVYGFLSSAERNMPEAERRTPAILARTALRIEL